MNRKQKAISTLSTLSFALDDKWCGSIQGDVFSAYPRRSPLCVVMEPRGRSLLCWPMATNFQAWDGTVQDWGERELSIHNSMKRASVTNYIQGTVTFRCYSTSSWNLLEYTRKENHACLVWCGSFIQWPHKSRVPAKATCNVLGDEKMVRSWPIRYGDHWAMHESK
jgi:hypothetical protein